MLFLLSIMMLVYIISTYQLVSLIRSMIAGGMNILTLASGVFLGFLVGFLTLFFITLLYKSNR